MIYRIGYTNLTIQLEDELLDFGWLFESFFILVFKTHIYEIYGDTRVVNTGCELET